MRALQGVLLLLYAGESVMGSGIGVYGTAEGMRGCQRRAGGEIFHESFGKRGVISVMVLSWLREIQQLQEGASLKWFGLQCSICSCGQGVGGTPLGSQAWEKAKRGKGLEGTTNPNHQL